MVERRSIAEAVLAQLGLTADETTVVRRTLETLVRERADGNGPARLSNPINIGIGTK